MCEVHTCSGVVAYFCLKMHTSTGVHTSGGGPYFLGEGILPAGECILTVGGWHISSSGILLGAVHFQGVHQGCIVDCIQGMYPL